MKSQKRNLNPTPEAVFAMFHWHENYASQGGGSMDFYDGLSERSQKYCQEAIRKIAEAKENHKL